MGSAVRAVIFSFPATSHAGTLMRAVGAVRLEGTAFTNMPILMAAERSHRDLKWELRVDTGSVLLVFILCRKRTTGVCVKSVALKRGQGNVDSLTSDTLL